MPVLRCLGVFLVILLKGSARSLIPKQLPPLLRALSVGIPVAVAGTAIAVEAYSRLPAKFIFGSNPRPVSPFLEDELLIIFPGAGGPDENTSNLAKAVIDSDRIRGIKRHVEVYDWSPWKGNLIRASFDGQNVGKCIGQQLANERNGLKSIHVVGVSVGAFAADSCTSSFQEIVRKRTAAKPSPYVRLTLLDPFTQRGLFGVKYGFKMFGKTADYCEQFMNTDDPVPSTNDPISQAYVYDITTSKARNSFTPLPGDNMHSWPVAYYGREWDSVVNPDGTLYQPLHDAEKQRGKVVKIP